VSTRFVDEIESAVGWIESARTRRTSHALSVDDRIWLIDPIEGDGVEERLHASGEPVGVIQLLDRHARDGAAFAERFGVPLHVVPRSLPETPFQLLPIVSNRWWQEVALWWPERRILVVADVLGTIPFFRAGDEPAGIHPLLRPWPPRSLRGLAPEHLLVGHGEGVHHQPTVVDSALRTARRRLPRLLLGLPRVLRGR
jgi:hypothetical protein